MGVQPVGICGTRARLERAKALADFAVFDAALHGEQRLLPTERKTVKVSESILEKYVGTYEFRPGFNLWFFIRDGQLISQATGQPDFPLVAESETKFFPLAFEADLEFQVDDTGKVTGLIHRQNGGELKVPRISDTIPVK